MSYETVFDATQTAHLGWRLASPALCVALFGLCFSYHAFLRGGRPLMRAVALTFFLMSSLVAHTLWNYANLERQGFLSVLASGKARVASGAVENYRLIGRMESFTVEGVVFSYDDALPTQAYHATAARGGPMREGLIVRIHYLAYAAYRPILKLERQSGEAPLNIRPPTWSRLVDLGLGAMAIWLILGAVFRRKRTSRFGKTIFLESLISGKRAEGGWRDYCGVNNALAVRVDGDVLSFKPVFPFDFMLLGRLCDLEEEVALADITSVEEMKYYFMKSLTIRYRKDGQDRAVMLFPSRIFELKSALAARV